MQINQQSGLRLSLSGRFSLYFFTVCLCLSASFSLVFFMTGRSQMVEDLKSRLIDIVSITRLLVDEQAHDRLLATDKPDKALYNIIQKNLQTIRDQIEDVYFVYTVTGNDKGQIVFCVDAEENPATQAHMGQIYDNPGLGLKQHFYHMSRPMVENEVYTDQWGTWLSGYVPLKSSGYPVAMGIDISAGTIKMYTNKILVQSLMIFLTSLPLILLMGYFLGRKLADPVLNMARAAEKIGKGEFEHSVPVDRNDELGNLAQSLNAMAGSLLDNQDRMEFLVKKYRSIFDNALEGIFQSTPSGHLLNVNRSMAAMAGYASPEAMIQGVKKLAEDFYARAQDRKRFLDILDKTSRVDRFRFQIKRKDHETFWGEMNAHYVESEESGMVIEGMIIDISQHMEGEKAEQERQAALAASHAKSDFLANMSHEIRTPLNAVIGLGDLLSRTDLSQKQQQYLLKMKSSSHALLALINDILDFSKIEAGHMELEYVPFSLYHVIENLTEMFAFKASEKDMELLVSISDGTPNALKGDPTRLGQILINLTANAMKFTSEGEIVITTALKKQVDDTSVVLEFSVRDTGAGIEASRIDQIFESFTQEDQSITRKFGGTGLGLTITKQLVGLMGGDIHVESTPGRGSTFSFTARFDLQPKENQLNILPPRDLRGLNVLIADDNQTALEIISEIIRSFEMNATTVSSGEEALEQLKQEGARFDLVLLDWKMQGMNGFETARKIKEELMLNETPIICMISAYGREDLVHEADRSLLDVFLHKPINPSLLFDSIMELYGKKVPETDHGVHDLTSGAYRHGAGNDETVIPRLNGRILLVEDNTINREIALEWLEGAGLTVSCAANGREAIDRLANQAHDMVLMDIQMPVMDGLEATRILRSMPQHKTLPIVAMTAHALKGDREKGMAVGMNDYITKPIDPAHLFRTLTAYLEPTIKPIQTARPVPNKAKSILPFTRLPGINLEAGLFRSNDNTKLYQRLLLNFHDEFSGTNEKIQTMKTQGQNDQIKKYLHLIKGVASNLGAEDLSEAVRILENLPPYSGTEYDTFNRELETVMEGLGSMKTDTEQNHEKNQGHTEKTVHLCDPEKKTNVPTLQDFIPLLKQLEQNIQDDLGLVEEFLVSHVEGCEYYLGKKTFNQLKNYLSDFALEEAEVLVHTMIEKLKKN